MTTSKVEYIGHVEGLPNGKRVIFNDCHSLTVAKHRATKKFKNWLAAGESVVLETYAQNEYGVWIYDPDDKSTVVKKGLNGEWRSYWATI